MLISNLHYEKCIFEFFVNGKWALTVSLKPQKRRWNWKCLFFCNRGAWCFIRVLQGKVVCKTTTVRVVTFQLAFFAGKGKMELVEEEKQLRWSVVYSSVLPIGIMKMKVIYCTKLAMCNHFVWSKLCTTTVYTCNWNW